MRMAAEGCTKFAVPTWMALAPATKNSAASSPVVIPPRPITGRRTARAASQTIRKARGLMAGPDSPPRPRRGGGVGDVGRGLDEERAALGPPRGRGYHFPRQLRVGPELHAAPL